MSLSEDLPVLVVVVDRPERVRDFLPQVTELVTDGLAVLDRVEVVHPGHGGDPAGLTAGLG